MTDAERVCELEAEVERLTKERDEKQRLNEYFRDAVGECHVMISRETAEYQIRSNWEATDLPPRIQKVMRQKEAAEAEAARLLGAILWALGEEGDFRQRESGEGAYWWRKELRQRAALSAPALEVNVNNRKENVYPIVIYPGEQVTVRGPDDGNEIGVLEMSLRGELAFFRQDGVMFSLSADTPLDTIFAEIMRRRYAQDVEHGGPEHDDTHTPSDWCRFIQKFRNRAETNPEQYEECLIDIASLAIAALQSSRRKRVARAALSAPAEPGAKEETK